LLHWSTLGVERKSLLKLIVDQMPIAGSYLAGGTALALMLGHRTSIDFNWFSPSNFDSERLARKLTTIKPFEVSEATEGALHGLLGDVRVTWLYYPNPLLDNFVTSVEMINLKLASLKDIGVMKLASLSHRGSAKDFVDLYSIHREGCKLEDLINLLPSKFPEAKINYYHIIKSFSYFEDAEQEPSPMMLIPLEWNELKRFFLEEQTRLLKKIDQLNH